MVALVPRLIGLSLEWCVHRSRKRRLVCLLFSLLVVVFYLFCLSLSLSLSVTHTHRAIVAHRSDVLRFPLEACNVHFECCLPYIICTSTSTTFSLPPSFLPRSSVVPFVVCGKWSIKVRIRCVEYALCPGDLPRNCCFQKAVTATTTKTTTAAQQQQLNFCMTGCPCCVPS